ncbi:tRNA (adenine(58)-N(1))-methyltransferase catalytic subunit [Podosphaera aphanis]|nr:tRNA (adenine(58)-N(1))-methyltransferase catalytic subunit [Podosphaera aphanis]
MTIHTSPFLFPGPIAITDRLAIAHLKRDLQIPVILRDHDEDDEGYAEGKVLNTRFGNFPHSTLIGLPWGSQVRASQVDTGSRGRRKKVENSKRKRADSEIEADSNKKIKLEDDEHDDKCESEKQTTLMEKKEAVTASSGFIHLLPPTPENWTSSLPHRTQVVYTPDYSYILHRLRARPGSRIIEAGAGSGSFTHASARAVFSGYPDTNNEDPVESSELGKVWSYEFHEQRYQKLHKEIQDHGLEGIVQIMHRDVCTDGFLIEEPCPSPLQSSPSQTDNGNLSDLKENQLQTTRKSPLATAVFLDLPAPWLALPHLSRSSTRPPNLNNSSPLDTTIPGEAPLSPLDPSAPVHICTFSPCIEQVQRTVSVMRNLGWVDINTVELSHRRYEVRRERIGLAAAGAQRGQQMTPANVDEAVARLLEVEGTFKSYHQKEETEELEGEGTTLGLKPPSTLPKPGKPPAENGNRREKMLQDLVQGKSYKEGKLVHRAEAEIKTHTSYLVFAVLPPEWSEDDESAAREMWPIPSESADTVQGERPMSKKAKKRAERAARKSRHENNDDSNTDVDAGHEKKDIDSMEIS